MKHGKVSMLILIVVVGALAFTGSAVAVSPTDAADKALAWLKTQQNDDGGFGSGFGPGSGAGSTADAILAIPSSGAGASTWAKGGVSPIDYLRAQASADLIKLPGEIAKTILALVATGQNPRDFGGRDLISN